MIWVALIMLAIACGGLGYAYCGLKYVKPVPHCELTSDQAQRLLRDLRVKMEWCRIMKSKTITLELTDDDLRHLISCMEKSHER